MSTFRVSEIVSTIQGEGALVGVPCIMIRLQGCNVHCSWCDTKHSWPVNGGMGMSALELVDAVRRVANGPVKWIMVTGGEPCMQDVGLLCSILHQVFYCRFMLETSGTAYNKGICYYDWVVVSPKRHCSVDLAVMRYVDEIKMVVTDSSDIEWFETWLDSIGYDHSQPFGLTSDEESIVVSLQPMSCSKELTELCYQKAQEKGWRLSIQIHKYIAAA